VLALDRIWIHPVSRLRRVFVHTSALARRASDHLPVAADLQLQAATTVSDA
jgi:endonuclease/exonuclease/phosphatase family metal-dependent hydrolase